MTEVILGGCWQDVLLDTHRSIQNKYEVKQDLKTLDIILMACHLQTMTWKHENDKYIEIACFLIKTNYFKDRHFRSGNHLLTWQAKI